MTACSGNTSSSNAASSTGSKTDAASQAASASTTDWPKKTVQVIVPAGAGGDTDFNARTFATYFKEITGQTMVITNQSGGGGSIATSTVKDAAKDGYTVLFGHTGQMIVNEVAGLINYNLDSFDIACIPAVDKGTVLVASKASGIASVADLLKKAKENPGKLLYGSELGGYSNLQGVMLEDKAGISFKIVDTGSASDKVSNLLAGRISLAAITYGTVKDYQKTGQLNVIAQFNSERNENLSDIPTLKEGGIDFTMEKPYIIAFPKGTDPAIISKMDSVAKQITENSDYAQALKASYNQPVSYYNSSDAVSLLKSTRDDFMNYKGKLNKS
ncbi:tripartite tricarboxylate transporter substrate binding protein [Caproiciproducens sp. NJN-50]|nr:tripartite tricarboxylate transporter substrate binding protein [Caproiciproducens sp. NJN-50]